MPIPGRIKRIFSVLLSLIIFGLLAYDLVTHLYYQNRISSLLESSRQAFHVQDFRKAGSEAADLLKTCELYNRMNLHSTFSTFGDAIHYGNIILGVIALTNDDLHTASNRLLLSGRTPGSPELNKFGPCTMLAEALLQRGERDIVVEYFQLCSQFWKTDEGQLRRWIKDITEGGIPNFGKRLCV